MLDRARGAINRALGELAAHHHSGHVPYAVGCGSILALLSPAMRSTFVQSAMTTGSALSKGKAIADLGLGMAHLMPEEQACLVEEALEMFADLNWESGHISGPMIALAGLLEAQNALTPEHRQRLVELADFAVGLNTTAGHPETPLNHSAVAKLGAAIRCLPPEKLARIVEFAICEPNEIQQAIALANMGVILANVRNLDADPRIVSAALQLNEGRSKDRAIISFAARIGQMQPLHKQQIINFALNMADEFQKAQAARQLGASAEHLSSADRETLVGLATSLNVGSLDADGQSCIRERLSGLAAGMPHLNERQRDGLAATALRFTHYLDQPKVIGALAPGLRYLEGARREELVTATIGIRFPYQRADGIARLGAGAGYLDNGQRNRLIDAVLATNAPSTKAIKVTGLSVIAASISAGAQPS